MVGNVTSINAAIYYTDAAGNKNVCPGTAFTTIQLV